jgi:hypothetical protein
MYDLQLSFFVSSRFRLSREKMELGRSLTSATVSTSYDHDMKAWFDFSELIIIFGYCELK